MPNNTLIADTEIQQDLSQLQPENTLPENDVKQPTDLSDDKEYSEPNNVDLSDENEEQPQLSEEEILQQEQKKKEEAEWRQKQEEGKIRKLTEERNQLEQQVIQNEANNILYRLNSNDENSAIEAAGELATDPKKFEQLKPHLAKYFPDLASMDYNTYVDRFNAQLQQFISVNPKAADQAIKARQNQVEQYANEELQRKEFHLTMQFDLRSEIPEFNSMVTSNADWQRFYDAAFQFAYQDAVNLNAQGQTFDLKQLTKQYLYRFNPTWQQKQVQAQNILNNISSDVKKAVQGAGTNPNTTNSKANLRMSKEELQAHNLVYRSMLKYGKTEQEAEKEANEFVLKELRAGK